MATDPHYRLLTVEEFLRIDFGPDMKAELDNGVIRMMAGGTRQHARVQANILAFARQILRGSGCRPYGSDMGVRSHDRSVRYPDVTIDCGERSDDAEDQVLSNPRVVFEVLSPSTRRSDLTTKKDEYKTMPTLDTIVFVDPDAESVSVLQRIPNGWTDSFFIKADVELPSLGITIPHAEIFARD